MRVLLIVNAFASSVTARSMVVIRKAFSADHDVEMVETSRRGHAARLARGAANDGVDVVVVMGGDGTLNEAANGLVGTDTALGVLPGGSTNVFARTLGLPNDPVEATGVLLDALAKGCIRRVGLGAVNGRCFLFHTGLGFDAAVVEQVERRSSLKRYAGHPLFVYAGFATWFRHYDTSRPRLAVHLPDGRMVDDGYMAIVLNTSPYTYLGNVPLDLAPEATLDTGLSVVVVRTMQFARVLGLIGSALASGRHIRSSRYALLAHDLDELEVTGHGPLPYQVDGDFLGDGDVFRFEHRADALNLVLPAGPADI
ncbi:diacylglycerol kinase family lipid kinase [Acidimicrobiia bacterium EGI L10123]|uniref:diacylglycerol/lipid kinase family protein n=1 Tax=Salinilacustrithrix flava TaxID=2957203 RepID=UPI003D7C1882|nr:diacylglycerol kinase family lipid kinase [Acidimicrobiia bacterium EGI L10123]